MTCWIFAILAILKQTSTPGIVKYPFYYALAEYHCSDKPYKVHSAVVSHANCFKG